MEEYRLRLSAVWSGCQALRAPEPGDGRDYRIHDAARVAFDAGCGRVKEARRSIIARTAEGQGMSEFPRPVEEWQAHLAEGRLMLQRSRSTGRFLFYPRIAAPGSGARDLEWVRASGRGTVHATTVVRRKPPEPSYNVVLVDLEEGVRLMSEVVDTAPDAVAIGMAVRARIDRDGPVPRLVFVREAIDG